MCCIDGLIQVCPEGGAARSGDSARRTSTAGYNPYYRKQIQEQMKTQDVIDLNELAAEQWQEAVTLPCAILSGKISHLPIQEVRSG